ncbi:hypothetical protein DICSQDRAFT_181129 [Dichomitus squalens LYAD-421 SS1]|uniref:Uncharacterized protein n=1 Tax=Dichomitus squalens (strain LYAD-421) TaxID=732165 RepID=R7T145_DICSQ|nr:uncharacterized protein DICSQDRAFT_181129 [Dichomitus squalens LYAD-421 SS1]EJF60902.1 hypothetical protein DICSQDRAFT_181129 [Dichomitus squalens LYAD-421 SS1]
MSKVFPAYIGKPPPHVLKKRRQREEQARARELSPAVPDPEPSTPAHSDRADVFGTINRSATRVYRTYAHKRTRSTARSGAEAESGGEEEEQGSRSSSPKGSSSGSPTKRSQKERARYSDAASPAKRPRLDDEAEDDHMYVDPLTFDDPFPALPAASTSQGPARRRKSSVYVEIQIPARRPRSQTQRGTSPAEPEVQTEAPSTSSARRRGRPSKVKPISIPTPSATSDEGVPREAGRQHRASGYSMTLVEALNNSFATSDTPVRMEPDEEQSIARPSNPESDPVKRGPGRVRGSGRGRGRGRGSGRGRGRSAGSPDPVMSHRGVYKTSPAHSTRSAASMPTWTALPTIDVGSPTAHQPPHIYAQEKEESTGDELETVAPPVTPKRPRGRPRKNPLPEASTSAAAAGMTSGQRKALVPRTPGRSRRATADPATPTPKRRGRPPGTKNKATLAREAAAAEVARRRASFPSLPSLPISSAAILKQTSANAIHALPPPAKRGPGRPRKSAPVFPTMFASDTIDFLEPLKDPDDDDDAPSPAKRTRSRSRQRRASVSGTPGPAEKPAATPRRGRSASSARTPRSGRDSANAAAVTATPKAPASTSQSTSRFYLDPVALEWRPRRRPASVSPPKAKRRPRPALHAGAKAAEFQSRKKLCDALKRALLEAPMPKVKQVTPAQQKQKQQQKQKSNKKGKKGDGDDGLKVAPSGVLLFGDKSAEEAGEGESEDEVRGEAMVVFNGSWAVITDPKVVFDDALALRTLHEVVMGIGAFISSESPTFYEIDGGKTITVAVPCGCMSLREGASSSTPNSSASNSRLECMGEMAVSVAEEIVPLGFAGTARGMRATVLVTH